MITKERLKELIEQRAIIYRVGMCFIFDYKLDKTYYIEDNNLVQSFCEFDDDVVTRYLGTFDELYETKEEAEWQLEFGNIQRTEILSLPSWEEFCEWDKLIPNYSFKFTSKAKEHFMLYLWEHKEIFIWSIDDRAYYRCWGEAIKENYIEACRLAKKLFLGEKV